MQTWVRDMTSPSSTEQKAMCTVSDSKVAFKPSAPIQPTNSHSLQAYVCSLYATNSACLNFIKALYIFSFFNILPPLGLRITQIKHPPSRVNDCIKAVMSPRMGCYICLSDHYVMTWQ